MLSFITPFRPALPIPIREVWFLGKNDQIPRCTLIPRPLRIFNSEQRIDSLPGRWRQAQTLVNRLDSLDDLKSRLSSGTRREIRQSIERDRSRVVFGWTPAQLASFARNLDAGNPNQPNLARMLALAALGGLGIASAFVGESILCAHVYVEDITLGVTRLLYSYSARPRRNGNDDSPRSPETTEFSALVGRTNKALHWLDMQRYHDRGFRIYDWGGYSGRKDNGIDRFKMLFRGEITPTWYFDGATPPRWPHLKRD